MQSTFPNSQTEFRMIPPTQPIWRMSTYLFEVAPRKLTSEFLLCYIVIV